MIRELNEEEQQEFDLRVEAIKRKAKFDYRPFGYLNGTTTPNFTNHLEVVPYGRHLALVKVPKFFSALIYNGKSLVEMMEGKRKSFPFRDRLEFEGSVLEELAGYGVKVPERIYTTVKGALVLKYNHEAKETKKVLREDSIYQYILLGLGNSLGQIHELGLHGEPTTNNTFVTGIDVNWANFEHFLRNPSQQEKSRELAELVGSAARHSYRPLSVVARYIFDGYPDYPVIDGSRRLLNR